MILLSKSLSFISFYLLFSLVTLASDVSGQSSIFYVYDEPNHATLAIESNEGVKGLSYFIKVNQTCFEESEKVVSIESIGMEKNISLIYSCYGDLYELEPSDNVELDLFIQYIHSHPKIDMGKFEFDLKGYAAWKEKLEQAMTNSDLIETL